MLQLITIHFYYRYLSVTSPTDLSRFSVKSTPIWILFIISISFLWFSMCYFVNGPSPMKDENFLPEFQKNYCMEPEEYNYLGPQYYYQDVTGQTRFHIPSLLASGTMGALMCCSISAITYFGFHTYKHLANLGTIGSSETGDLQKQLFRTLVIQTLIPSVFMYIPVSCMFLFPLFGLKAEGIDTLVPISVAIYPCFEPLVAMYCIRIFRNRIFGKKSFRNINL